MKIAVTSTNGVKVDLHFGEAKTFHIYQMDTQKGMTFLETRDSFGYCIDKVNHKFRRDRLDMVYDVIRDCEILYTARIGEVPEEKLREKGIEIRMYQGEVSGINALN